MQGTQRDARVQQPGVFSQVPLSAGIPHSLPQLFQLASPASHSCMSVQSCLGLCMQVCAACAYAHIMRVRVVHPRVRKRLHGRDGWHQWDAKHWPPQHLCSR